MPRDRGLSVSLEPRYCTIAATTTSAKKEEISKFLKERTFAHKIPASLSEMTKSVINSTIGAVKTASCEHHISWRGLRQPAPNAPLFGNTAVAVSAEQPPGSLGQ